MGRDDRLVLGLATVVVASFTLLLAVTITPPGSLAPLVIDLRWFAGALLGAGARLFAFRVYRRAQISIDSPIYISVAFQLNVISGAWLVAGVLTGDGLVRILLGRLRGEPVRQSMIRSVLERLYMAFVPALLMVTLGSWFRLDTLVHPLALSSLLVVVPSFSLSFLVLHYFTAGGLQWLDEVGTRSLLFEYLTRVLAVELALMPLSVALIVAFTEHGLGLFLLIGTIAVFFSAVYRRAMITSADLDKRVNQLSVLNAVGRLLSRTLDRTILFEALARGSCRLVGASSQFIFATPSSDGNGFHCYVYDDHGSLQGIVDVPRDSGLVGWTFAHREALRLDDLKRDCVRYGGEASEFDPSFNSWLGVPVVVYDEVIGVMAVESKEYRAYDDDHVLVLTTIADQAAIALENTRLYEMATVDGLTRLFVRSYYDRRLEEELNRAARYGGEFSVGILDLDRFKRVNDTYGHQAGDKILRATANVVRRNMRSADLVARYGGEEFAFIFPRTTLQAAQAVAERIRADIEDMRVETDCGVIQVTASIGLVSYPASHASDPEDLMVLADRALYRAKKWGRNRVETPVGESARAQSFG